MEEGYKLVLLKGIDFMKLQYLNYSQKFNIIDFVLVRMPIATTLSIFAFGSVVNSAWEIYSLSLQMITCLFQSFNIFCSVPSRVLFVTVLSINKFEMEQIFGVSLRFYHFFHCQILNRN